MVFIFYLIPRVSCPVHFVWSLRSPESHSIFDIYILYRLFVKIPYLLTVIN